MGASPAHRTRRARVWRDWALVAVLVPTAVLEASSGRTWSGELVARGLFVALVPMLLVATDASAGVRDVAFGVICDRRASCHSSGRGSWEGLTSPCSCCCSPTRSFAGVLVVRSRSECRWSLMLAVVAQLVRPNSRVVDGFAGPCSSRSPPPSAPRSGTRTRPAQPRDGSGQAARARAAGTRAPRHRRPSRLRDRHPRPGRPCRGRLRSRGRAGRTRRHRGGGFADARRDAGHGRRAPPGRGGRSSPRSEASPTSSGSTDQRRGRPRVEVELSGDLDGLRPSVDAAAVPTGPGVDHERGPTRTPRNPHPRSRSAARTTACGSPSATTATPARSIHGRRQGSG